MLCTKCNDTGILRKIDSDGYDLFENFCDCKIGKEKEVGLIQYRLKKANVYEKYWGIQLSDLHAQPLDNHAKYIKKIKEIASNINNYINTGYTMIIYGNSGVGKTMGTSLLLKNCLLTTNYDCYYTTMPDMLTNILTDADIDPELSFFEKLKDVDILVIDDIGLTAVEKSFPIVTIETVLRDRMASKKLTFLILGNGQFLVNQYKFITKLIQPDNIYDVTGRNGWILK